MTVTPDAVEAAARALDPVAFDPDGDLRDIFGHQERPSYRIVRQAAARATATRALAAAAPLIAKQTLLDAADAMVIDTALTLDLDEHVLSGATAEVQDTSAHWLTARAATLTPKEK